MATGTENRRAWHRTRLATAPDGRSRFWAACKVLAAAVYRRGKRDRNLDAAFTTATDGVLSLARTIDPAGGA